MSHTPTFTSCGGDRPRCLLRWYLARRSYPPPAALTCLDPLSVAPVFIPGLTVLPTPGPHPQAPVARELQGLVSRAQAAATGQMLRDTAHKVPAVIGPSSLTLLFPPQPRPPALPGRRGRERPRHHPAAYCHREGLGHRHQGSLRLGGGDQHRGHPGPGHPAQ